MKYDLAEMHALKNSGAVDESDFWAMLRSSQRDFGRLINRSGAFVNELAREGVVLTNRRGNVRVAESFRRYWQFLPPWERKALIASAMTAVATAETFKPPSPLTATLELSRAIRQAQFHVLKIELLLRMIDGAPTDLLAAFEAARRYVHNLQRRQQRARRRLREELASADLPAPLKETIRLRYAEMKKIEEVARALGKSRRQIFRYLKAGKAALLC